MAAATTTASHLLPPGLGAPTLLLVTTLRSVAPNMSGEEKRPLSAAGMSDEPELGGRSAMRAMASQEC
jgi:hypothetical protein